MTKLFYYGYIFLHIIGYVHIYYFKIVIITHFIHYNLIRVIIYLYTHIIFLHIILYQYRRQLSNTFLRKYILRIISKNSYFYVIKKNVLFLSLYYINILIHSTY